MQTLCNLYRNDPKFSDRQVRVTLSAATLIRVYCLPFRLHLFSILLDGKNNYTKFLDVQIFQIFMAVDMQMI